MSKRPVLLTILDGFGMAPAGPGNAIEAAHKPNFDSLKEKYPFVYGYASGEAVGLPDGQMGNSEVGHLNIGAGRIVYQDLTRISKAIKDGAFFENEALLAAVKNCKENDSAFHICGLVSDGGVHSYNKQLYAILELAKQEGLKKVFVHVFADGRDTDPESADRYVGELIKEMESIGVGKIASITGRYYSMDRDNRWDRVEKAYRVMAFGEGERGEDPLEVIRASYASGVTDEFILPTAICEDGKPVAVVEEGDSLIFNNFRPDRARELTRAFCVDDFDGFDRGERKKITFVCMTDYDPLIPNKLVAFKKEALTNTFGEVLATHGLKQLRLAETEKYAHVTFFFNGGVEEPNIGEDRILVPSPKVATYDLQPEMSADMVCDKLVEALKSKKYDAIIVNFANPDMVGHTGVFEAAKAAIEEIDVCLGRIYEEVKGSDVAWFICADHGNSECMINEKNGEPMTAHTTNPVPFILVNYDEEYTLADRKGGLCDIIPTLMEIMELDQPEEMTGRSLLVKKM